MSSTLARSILLAHACCHQTALSSVRIKTNSTCLRNTGHLKIHPRTYRIFLLELCWLGRRCWLRSIWCNYRWPRCLSSPFGTCYRSSRKCLCPAQGLGSCIRFPKYHNKQLRGALGVCRGKTWLYFTKCGINFNWTRSQSRWFKCLSNWTCFDRRTRCHR